jgi:hypothetical protein
MTLLKYDSSTAAGRLFRIDSGWTVTRARVVWRAGLLTDQSLVDPGVMIVACQLLGSSP